MVCGGKILGNDGHILTLALEEPVDRELMQKKAEFVEVRVEDGRGISPKQRGKVFALIRDISLWSGHDPEYLRQLFTWDFVCRTGGEPFSLSTVDMTTARAFISYLIDFCFVHNVPTKKPLSKRTDDIDRYLYQCLEHRKCAVCNAPAQVHHIDRVGMGRDRLYIHHEGLRAVALCAAHHREAHDKGKDFLDREHIYGIPLDRHLCRALGLPE